MIRLLVSAIVLSLNGVEAHEPEETIYPVFWWWPEELQPVIDGIPDLPLQDESTFAGFWPYMISSKWSRTQENEAPDPHSLYSQILVGWGEPGQLYIQEWRYDDQ